jgi:hypothetical protein
MLRLAPAWALAVALAACGGDATAWESPLDASSIGWLLSTWGPGDGTRWAVGGSPDAGVAYHFDGEAWAPVVLPEGTPLLDWCFGFGADEVYFVGEEGTFLRFGGAGFEAIDTGVDAPLWGVWGASPDDLWLVGGSGLAGDDLPVVLRYDGASVAPAPLPVLERAGVHAFFKVWGTAADDVHVVGQHGAILHFDGEALVELGAGTSEDLISLWGTGPDRIVAVGGRANGVVAFWDGASWTSQSVAPVPGLNGVWMRTPDVAHVVGVQGTLGVLDVRARTVELAPPSTRLDFHAVHGDATGLTAVGGSLASAQPPFEGVIQQRELHHGE